MTSRSTWFDRVEGQWVFVFLAAAGAILFSLLVHWEIAHETVGYWLFARIFAETGEFIIPDRSPLYTLYLNGFRWMGYPTSVTVEYLVSTSFLVAAMVAVFRPYLRPRWAIFAVILWIPIFQLAEPSVQKMALACVCWAVVARRGHKGAYGSAASYALLGMAYMFRSPFAIFLVIFLAWDLISALRLRTPGIIALFQNVRPRLSHWPVILIVALMVVFMARQSDSPWNNVYFSSTTFFPNDGKSFTMVQNWNWGYIINHYQTFVGHDFYDTNIELFGGASDTLDMIRANPSFVAKQTFRWGRDFVNIGARMTELPRFWSWLPLGNHYMAPAALAALVFGAFAAARRNSDVPMALLVLGGILLVGSTVITRPEARYMVPVVPVLILSAVWYAAQAQRIFGTLHHWNPKALLFTGLAAVAALSIYFVIHVKFTITNFGPSIGALLHPNRLDTFEPAWAFTLFFVSFGYLVAATMIFGSWSRLIPVSQWLTRRVNFLLVPIVLLLFSNGLFLWEVYVLDIINDVRHGEVRVMESRRGLSTKDSREMLASLASECRGVLAIEHTFLGSFTDFPLDRIYDVMEIPPFGSLGTTDYDGLRPDRVDCVLVSETLANQVGAATNVKLRYENYVVPYVRQLQEMGASTFTVPNFGEAIILNDSNAGTNASAN